MAYKKISDNPLFEKIQKNIDISAETVRTQHETQRRLDELYRQEYVPEKNKSLTPDVQANLYLSNIETMMPVVDDNLGWINYEGREENDFQYGDILQLRMDALFDFGGLREAVHQASKDAKIMRNGITQAKIEIAPQMGPDGALTRVFKGIRWVPVNPRSFYPSPGFTGLDIRKEQADWIAFKTPMHIDAIKRIYRIEVEPEGDVDVYGVFKEKEGNDEFKNYAIINEYYFMDDNMSRYPNGRGLMWCQDYQLADQAMDDHIPYFMIKNYTTAHSGWGISETELAKPFVETINSILSNSADVAINLNKPLFKAKPSWIKRVTTKIVTFRKTGQPIPDLGGETEFGPAQELPQTSVMLPREMKAFLDNVSGIHDNMAGKAKGADQSGVSARIFEAAAMRRVNEHLSQDVQPYLQEIGEFALNIVQKYDSQIINLKKQIDPENAQWVPYDPGEMRDHQFNVLVSVGKADRAERVAEEMALYKEGLATDEDVINVLPIRDKRARLQRLHQQKGIAAEMEHKKELEQAEKDLNVLVDQILNLADKPEKSANDNIRLKLMEDRVKVMITNFNELLHVGAWAALPMDMQQRITLAAFVKTPETLVAGQPG